jgi:hypothetical protein
MASIIYVEHASGVAGTPNKGGQPGSGYPAGRNDVFDDARTVALGLLDAGYHLRRTISPLRLLAVGITIISSIQARHKCGS